MYSVSRFKCIDGKPDEMEIETWAEAYFGSMMNIFNGFFCHVGINDALSRMVKIPFEKLVQEQLDGESQEVIDIAVAKVKDLADIEIEHIKAYAE